MFIDGLKISWRYFKSGFIHNLAMLFILIVSNAILLIALMLDDNKYLMIKLFLSALIGYGVTTLIATYATKFRMKEFTLRKLLGVRYGQILMLTTIDSLIHMGASAIFSIIIVEHIYENHTILTSFSLLLVGKFFVLLTVLSVLISVVPALRLNAIKPQEL